MNFEGAGFDFETEEEEDSTPSPPGGGGGGGRSGKESLSSPHQRPMILSPKKSPPPPPPPHQALSPTKKPAPPKATPPPPATPLVVAVSYSFTRSLGSNLPPSRGEERRRVRGRGTRDKNHNPINNPPTPTQSKTSIKPQGEEGKEATNRLLAEGGVELKEEKEEDNPNSEGESGLDEVVVEGEGEGYILIKDTPPPELEEAEGEEEGPTKYVQPIAGPVPKSRRSIRRRYRKLGKILKGAVRAKDPSFVPPKFPTSSIDCVGVAPDVAPRLRLAAKQRIWERMSVDLLSQEEMMKFYGVLEKWADRPPVGLDPKWFKRVDKNLRKRGLLTFDKYLDAPSFLRARLEMDPRIRDWITMRHFQMFIKESDDSYFRRVPIIHLFNYVMKKVWLKQTRLGFMNYDQHGQGYLTEEWLESYIRELLPTLVQLEGLDPALEAFYLCVATRKFFFFLDPKRVGKIRIVDILASMLLDEILELRDPDVKERNWFSKQSMLRVYQHYLHLDRDSNGMICAEEFMRYNFSTKGVSVRFTRAFVQQLFSQKMTFHGEMDFRSFVDFVLAMENRKQEAAIAYFMRILDLNGKGYLNSFDLHFYYKDVYNILSPHNSETPKFDDVKDEIFDMVKPADPLKITVKDLYKCGKGDVVLSMLIDARGFDEYENRESVVLNNTKSTPPPPPPPPRTSSPTNPLI